MSKFSMRIYDSGKRGMDVVKPKVPRKFLDGGGGGGGGAEVDITGCLLTTINRSL